MLEIVKIIFIKLLTVSLISGAIVAAVQMVSPLLKKRYSARWRYWVWLIFAVWLLVPVTFSLDQAPVQISVSDPVIAQTAAEVSPLIQESSTENTSLGDAQGKNPSQENPVSPQKTEKPDTEAPVTELPATGTLAAAVSEVMSHITVLDAVITVWLMGMVIFLIRYWVSAARFQNRLRRKWRPCDSAAVVRSVRGAMEGMGFHKEIDIKFCKEIQSPFMTGLIHPVLILPEQDFDPYLLAHITRHEITHFRRRDLWYKLFINLATAVHWFNPLVWVMNRASDRDLELVCDELVIRGHDISSRKDYGESILLTVKPGMDRRPAALTTSFSKGAKNLKERFESIMLTTAKRSGIFFLALVVMLAMLASCGTGINLNKLDWTLYTNTEWRSEDADADLYFKNKGTKGIVFDLYISQICIVENIETAGKLKSSQEGYVDTVDYKIDNVSLKADVTFSPNGDYVIVAIKNANGISGSLGAYTFVKVNSTADTINLKNICGTFYYNGILSTQGFGVGLSLNIDGTASLGSELGDARLYEDSTGTFTIQNNQIIYKRSSDNRPTEGEHSYARSDKYDSLPETTVITIIDKDTLKIEERYFTILEIPSDCEDYGMSFNPNEVVLSRHVDENTGNNDLIRSLTMNEYKELNLFLSNFAETQMWSYYDGKTDGFSQTQITVFAIEHIFLNDKKSVTTINGTPDPIHGMCDYSIDAATVDAVLARYVGPHQKGGLPVSSDGWDSGTYFYFKNGKYYFSMWDRTITEWAQATRMFSNKDGTYTVVFDQYSIYDGNGSYRKFPDNRYEPKANWGNLSNIKPVNTHTAVIKKGVWNNNEVWQLVSYT